MRSTVAFCLGGVLLESGCVWLLVWSPQLTSIYTPEFTNAFRARLPWLQISLPIQMVDPHSLVLVLECGLLGMVAGYLLGLAGVTNLSGRDSARLMVGFALMFRVTLLMLPGLFSTDIFSYVMYGRIAAVDDGNPYVQVPADFPNDPFLSWVFPFWRTTPTVYGPLWTDFSWLLGRLTRDMSSLDQVLVYRLSLAAMDLVALWLIWRLLEWLHSSNSNERQVAFYLYAWNPVVLFDLVGSSHNDTAMVALLLIGVFLVTRERDATSVLVLTLSALVKYATALGLLLWIVASTARLRVGARYIRGAVAVGSILGVTLLAAWPWQVSPAVLSSISSAATGSFVINSAPDLIALTVADEILVPLGAAKDSAEATSRTWTRIITRAIFAGYFTWELSRLWRHPQSDRVQLVRAVIRAASRALLVFPLLVLTWVWSWYLSWSLALAVLLGWTSWLTRLVVLYTLIDLPIVYAHQYLNQDLSGLFVMFFALGPLVVLSAWRELALDH